MKTKSITITVGRTISLAPYESSRVEVQQIVELDKDDDADECMMESYKSVTVKVAKFVENEKRKGLAEIAERKGKK